MARLLDRLGRNAARHHWWFIGAWLVAADPLRRPRGRPRRPDQRHLHDPGRPVAEGARPARSAVPEPGRAPPPPSCSTRRRVSTIRRCSRRSRRASRTSRSCRTSASVGNLITATIDQFAGKIALVTAQYDTQAQDVGLDSYELLQTGHRNLRPTRESGSRSAARSSTTRTSAPSGDADLIGLLAAVIILLFAFGSVVAMGLPILTALFGLGVGVALINIVAAFTTIGTLAPILATMIGLGVGIDYSLFIVTRYRENIADGMTIEDGGGPFGRHRRSSGAVRGMHGGDRDLRSRDLGHPVRREARLHGGARGGRDDAGRDLVAPRGDRRGRQEHQPLAGTEPDPSP